MLRYLDHENQTIYALIAHPYTHDVQYNPLINDNYHINLVLLMPSIILAITLLGSIHLCVSAQILSVQSSQGSEKQSEFLRCSISNPNGQGVKDFRLSILEKNKRKVQAHNKQTNRSYQLGLNCLALLDENQVSKNVLSLIPSQELTIDYSRSKMKRPTYVEDDQIGGDAVFGEGRSDFDVAELELGVLNIVRNHLQKIGLTPTQIEQELKTKLDASNPNLRRNLQTIITNQVITNQVITNQVITNQVITNQDVVKYKTSDRSQFLSNFQIKQQELQQYNVDWSCVAGNVRIQGFCGSCYAFATLDAFSMLMTIYRHQFYLPMSVQQLIDCSNQRNQKNALILQCYGGTLEGAYIYMRNHGIILDNWYPDSPITLKEGISGDCKSFDRTKRYRIKNFKVKLQNDCNAVRKKLLDQPLAIGIAGSNLLLYKSGVFDCNIKGQDQNEGKNQINHAVVLVGYQAGKGWKIKNSWGRQWGQDGFGWIKDGNSCRICELTTFIEPEDKITYINYIRGNKMKTC